MANVSATNLTSLYSAVNGVSPVSGGYGNANVVGLLSAGTDGSNTVSNISATGNIVTGGILTDGYYYANGQPFSGGGGGTYGDANVVTLLAAFGSNTVSTTGNVTSGNVNTTGVVSAGGNVRGANFNTVGAVSATGNITGSYFIGNGSQLTGIVTTLGTNISVAGNVTAGANIIGGNVKTTGFVSATGIVYAGNIVSSGTIATTTSISADGNITGGNLISNGVVTSTGNITAPYFVGNGSALSALTGANVSGTVANATYATSAGSATTATSATTAGTVTTAAQGNITSVGTLTSLSVAGTVQGGNIATAGTVSSTGNITGSYFLGNGSLLTGLPETYGNANVAAYLPTYSGVLAGSSLGVTGAVTGATVSTTGNITGSYFFGNGSQMTGLSANVSPTLTGNLDMANYVIFSSSRDNVVVQDALISTGNITGANLVANNAVFCTSSNIASGAVNLNSGGISTTGTMSATGNIQGGNVNTGAISATGAITAAGNIAGLNLNLAGGITATGSDLAIGTISATGNIRGGNIRAVATGSTTGDIFAGGNVSAAGNIIGSYFVGNGSALTGITASGTLSGNMVGNISGANTYVINNLPALNMSSLGTISTTGNISTGNVIFETDGKAKFGAVEISNYNNRLYVNTDVQINAGLSTVSNATVGGNVVASGYITATGNITGSYFNGNGSALTGITAAAANTATFLKDTSNTYLMSLTNDGSGQSTVNLPNNGLILGNVGVAGGNELVITSSVSGAPVGLATNDLNNTIIVGTVVDGISLSAGAGNAEIGLSQSTGAVTLTGTGNVSLQGVLFPNGVTTTGGLVNFGSLANIQVGNLKTFYTVETSTLLVNSSFQTNTINLGNATVAGNLLLGNVGYISTNTGGNININTFGGNVNWNGNLIGSSSTAGIAITNYKDTVVTITYGSTITPNIALGSIQQVTLTGNVTMNAFGGTPQAGQSMVIKFIQDGTGGRVLSSTMKWAGGNKTLSTAANAVDIASVFYDGTTYYASLSLAYA